MKKPVTVASIVHEVLEIAKIADRDPEVAHSRQDALFVDVLVAITEDQYGAAALAEAALTVAEVDFPRWTA